MLLVSFLVIGAMGTAWIVWLLRARVSVYAVSEGSRLETAVASQPIQSLYAGRITANYLALGRDVKRGDTLVELDTDQERLQFLEESTQDTSLTAEMSVLQGQIAAQRRALEEDQRAAATAGKENDLRLHQAQSALAYGESELEVKTKLNKEGLLSHLELAHARNELEKQNAEIEGLRLEIERQHREQLSHVAERRSQIESLRLEVARLAGSRTKQGATLDRLRSEMQLRRIVASIDGIVGEVASLRTGAVVSPGEQLGAIIPSGRLKIVAQFNPSTALGRVHEGQAARLRFDAFPWTQYGSLSATVTNVAGEVRDGHVRVELRPAPGSGVPLRYGLTGVTEVEIEKITPLSLLLRMTGQLIAPEKAESSPTKNGGSESAGILR
jgi:membrane fusion protein (multidrug efflux system)